jgi:hypothetical protein
MGSAVGLNKNTGRLLESGIVCFETAAASLSKG